MNAKYAGVLLVVAAVAGGFLFLGREHPSPSTDRGLSTESDAVFALELTDYNGATISLASFKGTPLVINSWAAWCPFCRKELPDFATAQEEFGDTVVIIAIDRAESLAVAKKYTDQLGVTDKIVLLLDPTDSFYRSIGGFSMPETIFVDKDGVIVDRKRGPMALPEIRSRIETLLRS